MDFVMSGPRLQASLSEGFENVGGASQQGYPLDRFTAYSTWDSFYNWTSSYSDIFFHDAYNGTQILSRYGYYGGNLSNDEYNCRARYAVKSNEDPNVYLIYNFYRANYSGIYLADLYYYNITDLTASYYAPQRTFSVTFNLDEFWSVDMRSSYTPKDISETSSNLFSGLHTDEHFRPFLVYGTNSAPYGNLSNPASTYAKCQISGNNATCTYTFAANCNIIRMNGTGSNTTGMCFNFFPLKLNGRKYGGPADKLIPYTSWNIDGIKKVYSPQKGCMALKCYMNGEIPIFQD